MVDALALQQEGQTFDVYTYIYIYMYAYLHLVLRQQGWYSLNCSFKSNINIKKIRRRRLRHRNHRCSVAYGTEKKSSLKTVPRVLWQERCEDHVLVQMLNVWRQLSVGGRGKHGPVSESGPGGSLGSNYWQNFSCKYRTRGGEPTSSSELSADPQSDRLHWSQEGHRHVNADWR